MNINKDKYKDKAAKYLAEINEHRHNLSNGYTLLPLNIKLGYALLIEKNETLDTIRFSFLIKNINGLFTIINLNIIDNKNDDFSKKIALKKISLFITECIYFSNINIINTMPLSAHINRICKQCLNSIELWSKELCKNNSLFKNFSFKEDINTISTNSIIDNFLNTTIYYYLQEQITINNEEIFSLLTKIKKYISKPTTKFKFMTLGIDTPKINIKTQLEDKLHLLDVKLNARRKIYIIPNNLNIETNYIISLINILLQKNSPNIDLFEIILCDYNCDFLCLKNKSSNDLSLLSNVEFKYMYDTSNSKSIINSYLERHAF